LLYSWQANQFHGGAILRSLTNSKGFTLIEVLIALIILSVSLLALASLTAVTTKNNSFGSHMTEAATFAQDKLEELRAIRWDQVGSSNDQKTGSTGVAYSRNWNVNQNGSLKTITISVNWNDQGNRSMSLISVLSQ
jgi:type IV pilus assembly protein PilV